MPVTPPEDVTVVIESSTYFLVDASESAAGAPICNFANVALPKSVCVEPSSDVVPTLNLSASSSQKNTALLPAAPLLIINPESLPIDPELFKTIMLSSIDKFCESIVVVVPVTVRSPVILVSPTTSNLKLPGVAVPTPILPLSTSTTNTFVLNARSVVRIRLDSNNSPAIFVIAIILLQYLPIIHTVTI